MWFTQSRVGIVPASILVRQDNTCQPDSITQGSHEESRGGQVCCIGTCLEEKPQYYTDWANVSIIDRDSQTISRRIREAIHIRRSSGASLMNRDEGLELVHMWDLLLNIMKSTKVQTLDAYCTACLARVLRTMPMRVRGSWPRLAL